MLFECQVRLDLYKGVLIVYWRILIFIIGNLINLPILEIMFIQLYRRFAIEDKLTYILFHCTECAFEWDEFIKFPIKNNIRYIILLSLSLKLSEMRKYIYAVNWHLFICKVFYLHHINMDLYMPKHYSKAKIFKKFKKYIF